MRRVKQTEQERHEKALERAHHHLDGLKRALEAIRPGLSDALLHFVAEHADVHGVSEPVAVAMLVRSGALRLHASRRYAASPKGEAAERRHLARVAAGTVKRRRRPRQSRRAK